MTNITYGRLRAYVAESNVIEGIVRGPTDAEVEAHMRLLTLDCVALHDVVTFVTVVAPGHRLRSEVGVDVRIGAHHAPPGGPQVVHDLAALLVEMRRPYVTRWHGPRGVHERYLNLHPFTDGNGRSARALYLRDNEQREPDACASLLRYGFLRHWYYESLADADTRIARTRACDPVHA